MKIIARYDDKINNVKYYLIKTSYIQLNQYLYNFKEQLNRKYKKIIFFYYEYQNIQNIKISNKLNDDIIILQFNGLSNMFRLIDLCFYLNQ